MKCDQHVIEKKPILEDPSRREFLSDMAKTSAAFSLPLMLGAVGASCTSVGYSIAERSDRRLVKMGTPEGRTPMAPVASDIRSPLAIITDQQSVQEDGRIHPAVVHSMIRKGIRALGGTSKVEDGWAKVFPAYKKGEKIGILINPSQELRTQAEVVAGLVQELINLGIAPADIIVWGNVLFIGMSWKKMGFDPLVKDFGVTLRTSHDKEAGFDTEHQAELPSADLRLPFSRILTSQCDYVISVPVLKSHSLCGVTGALKLSYGTIPIADALLPGRGSGAPSRRHLMDAVKKVHANNGDPQIAELAANPVIRQKTCLYLGDALLSRYDGGPFGPPQWINRQILVSQDPVALDYQAFQIVEKKRLEKNLQSIILWCKFIQTAAEMGLGTNHPDQIAYMSI